MAVAYSSVESGSNTGNLTITKPTGVADGDLMIAIIGIANNNSSGLTLSGWTSLTEVDYGNGYLTILYRVAGGSEGANYTFVAPASDTCVGAIIRITGTSFTAGASNIKFDTDTEDTDATPTYTAGVTPHSANTLLVMGTLATGDPTAPVSSYAIVTDNPTWTERVDIDESGTFDSVIAFATAPRAEATPTGNYSLAITGSPATSIGFLLAVQEDESITVNVDPLIIASTIPTASITGDSNVTATPLIVTSTVPSATVTTPDNLWENDSKSSTTWVNENKS